MTAIEEPSVQGSAGEQSKIGPIPVAAIYIAVLVTTILLLLVSGLIEVLSWPAVALGVAAVAATRIEGAHWVPLGGGILFAVLVFLVAFIGVGDSGYEERLASHTANSADVTVPAAASGSLDLRWGEVAEKWNALGQPPSISGGLIRETESGPYDSFRYRFDAAAAVAGAFDPDDGSVHVLMGTVGLFHEAAPNFYLHLCFVLHPYSQECIDAYFEEGLRGRQLAEFAGVDHRVEWEVGEQLWKLEIAGDVQTIRVFSKTVR